MEWQLSYRADYKARVIADRHYNRQSVGSAQFVPPGRCCVLWAPGAFWVTSYPFAEYVKHKWAGAWICSAFRRESGACASQLIREALQASRWAFGDPPELGMVTFLDRGKVRPIQRRGKPHWGYIWELSGFNCVGETEGGLLAFQIMPQDIPPAVAPLGTTMELFDVVAAKGDAR